MTLPRNLEAYRGRVEAALDRWLPPASQHPTQLHEAMRYAVLGGGKRLRPLLMYAAAEALNLDPAAVDSPAAAVEMVHAYSLVHDDLPAMDDDDLRRGRPSCHKAYGEALAILAGDALMTLAFHVLARDDSPRGGPAQRLAMVELLANAGGSRGMAGGQAMDLAATGGSLNVAEIEAMHIHKTGALIRASVLMACHAAALPPAQQLRGLDRYGKCLGLAFQIQDDILDERGDPAAMGKQRGADRGRAKPTYASVVGVEAAAARARELVEDALAAIAPFGDRAQSLRGVARQVIERDR